MRMEVTIPSKAEQVEVLAIVLEGGPTIHLQRRDSGDIVQEMVLRSVQLGLLSVT